jgi:hypothetical protein
MPTIDRSLCARLPRVFVGLFLLLVCFGSAKAQTYTLSTSANSLTLITQQQGTVSVTVTPVNGFTGNVILSCGALPEYASCIWPNNNFAVLSGGAVTLPLSINTSAIYSYQPVSAKSRKSPLRTEFAMLLWPAAFVFLVFSRKNRALMGRMVLFLFILYPIFALTGCQNTFPQSTAPGTYNILIQGGVPANVTTSLQLIVKS